jgi:hypothetical protein
MGDDDNESGGSATTTSETATPGKPPRGRPFQPGNSLGARGRPKKSAAAKRVLANGSLPAARELVRLAREARSENVRAGACRDVLAYVIGPAKALVEITGGGAAGTPASDPVARLFALIGGAKDAAATDGAPAPTEPAPAPPGANGEPPGRVLS